MKTSKKVATRKAGGIAKKSGGLRQIGRPESPEQSVGRDTLIDKTCELIAKMPPAMITRAEVARYAGVDPGLIRYYFANRTSLLVASTERLMFQFDETFEKGLNALDHSPPNQLRARVAALYDLVSSHPFYHRLITEELLTSEAATAKDILERMTKRGVKAYEQILAAGDAEGSLRPVNSVYLFVAVIGMCEAFVTLSPLLDVALGKTVAPRARSRQYEDFVWDILLNGISSKLPMKLQDGALRSKTSAKKTNGAEHMDGHTHEAEQTIEQ